MTPFEIFKVLGLSIDNRPLYRTNESVTFQATFVDKTFTVEVAANPVAQRDAAYIYEKAEALAVIAVQKALAKALPL